jgi:hypothetical protein
MLLRIRSVSKSLPSEKKAPMASAKISCFDTASNRVMDDRNLTSSGEPRMASIQTGAFNETRPENIVGEIGDRFAS